MRFIAFKRIRSASANAFRCDGGATFNCRITGALSAYFLGSYVGKSPSSQFSSDSTGINFGCAATGSSFGCLVGTEYLYLSNDALSGHDNTWPCKTNNNLGIEI